MNSSESSSVGFGNISSAALVLGTTLPIMIFGLATNCLLIFKICQCIEFRHQAVSTLLLFVMGADVFNSGFGPSIILLQFFDSTDEKVYYINYLGCLHVLFKVMSALFQSIVQFNRVLRIWSPRQANKWINRHALVVIVPGVLGLAGIVSMFPFITRNSIRPTENPHYDHQSVLFRVVYIVTTSGFTTVSSLLLLVFYCHMYLKARSSVDSMTTLEQSKHVSSLLKHGVKCTNTKRSKLPNTSTGHKQVDLNSVSKYAETTLSKSLPNIRQSTTSQQSMNVLSQDMSSCWGARLPKSINEAQHMHNNEPTSLKVRHLDDASHLNSTGSWNLTNGSPVHSDVHECSTLSWLLQSKSTFLLAHGSQSYREPLKKGEKMGLIRKSPVVLLPISNFNEVAEAEVGTTESMIRRKSHSGVATNVDRGIPLQETDMKHKTKTPIAENKKIHYNTDQRMKRQALDKQRRLSLGNITPGMNVSYAFMLTKSIYVRKIVVTVIFVLTNSFSGMHNSSCFFDISGRFLTNVEFTAIVLSNLICIVNPVYNTLVCEKVLKLVRCTTRN